MAKDEYYEIKCESCKIIYKKTKKKPQFPIKFKCPKCHTTNVLEA